MMAPIFDCGVFFMFQLSVSNSLSSPHSDGMQFPRLIFYYPPPPKPEPIRYDNEAIFVDDEDDELPPVPPTRGEDITSIGLHFGSKTDKNSL
mgnify:CR=1 FL=1